MKVVEECQHKKVGNLALSAELQRKYAFEDVDVVYEEFSYLK